jgi:hypothetical protein
VRSGSSSFSEVAGGGVAGGKGGDADGGDGGLAFPLNPFVCGFWTLGYSARGTMGTPLRVGDDRGVTLSKLCGFSLVWD